MVEDIPEFSEVTRTPALVDRADRKGRPLAKGIVVDRIWPVSACNRAQVHMSSQSEDQYRDRSAIGGLADRLCEDRPTESQLATNQSCVQCLPRSRLLSDDSHPASRVLPLRKLRFCSIGPFWHRTKAFDSRITAFDNNRLQDDDFYGQQFSCKNSLQNSRQS
jgi:hypothetical protein